MPKVMVLFFGDESSAAVVDAVVAGAKSVRFTEVEVRSAANASDASATHPKRLDPAHPTAGADGVVIIAHGAASASPAIAQVIDHLAHAPSVRDLVLGVAADASVIDRVARTGGIVIVSRTGIPGAGAAEEARALGVRVAKVAGWVRHGLGHEAEAQRGSHDHAHHDHDHHPHDHTAHVHNDKPHRDHQH